MHRRGEEHFVVLAAGNQRLQSISLQRDRERVELSQARNACKLDGGGELRGATQVGCDARTISLAQSLWIRTMAKPLWNRIDRFDVE